MAWFLGGIVALIVGYFTYGRLIERLLRPDDRRTPCYAMGDGVDYVPLPMWKNMLIQLLNIAGVGPVIGVIIGIKFGWECFWIIPLGCVFGGAVHDYVSGFMSVRTRGANLPALTEGSLGRWYTQAYAVFLMVLLLLVVAVFINVPAHLAEGLVRGAAPSVPWFWIFVGIIFLYYIVATLFPVDAIIGKIYPFFGAVLLIGSVAMLVALVWNGVEEPWLFTETEGFKAGMFKDQPIVPCLFVTIACGIISGFFFGVWCHRFDLGGGGHGDVQHCPRVDGAAGHGGVDGEHEAVFGELDGNGHGVERDCLGHYVGRHGVAKPAPDACGDGASAAATVCREVGAVPTIDCVRVGIVVVEQSERGEF